MPSFQLELITTRSTDSLPSRPLFFYLALNKRQVGPRLKAITTQLGLADASEVRGLKILVAVPCRSGANRCGGSYRAG